MHQPRVDGRPDRCRSSLSLAWVVVIVLLRVVVLVRVVGLVRVVMVLSVLRKSSGASLLSSSTWPSHDNARRGDVLVYVGHAYPCPRWVRRCVGLLVLKRRASRRLLKWCSSSYWRCVRRVRAWSSSSSGVVLLLLEGCAPRACRVRSWYSSWS